MIMATDVPNKLRHAGTDSEHTQLCEDEKFDSKENFCASWCNVEDKWPGCGIHTLTDSYGRNTGGADYTCSCAGCSGCADAPADSAQCTDVLDWNADCNTGSSSPEPSKLNHKKWTCAEYESKGWCKDGGVGDAWDNSWNWAYSSKETDCKEDRDSMTAKEACCVCGKPTGP